MKINLRTAAQELEAWAADIGWKNVAGLVAEHHFDFRESALTPAGLHNVEQKIRRTFRGKSAHYQRRADALMPAVLAAMPAERRARLESPDNPALLATVAAREGIQALNAVHLRAPADVIEREINQAIAALQSVRSAVIAWHNGGRYGEVHV